MVRSLKPGSLIQHSLKQCLSIWPWFSIQSLWGKFTQCDGITLVKQFSIKSFIQSRCFEKITNWLQVFAMHHCDVFSSKHIDHFVDTTFPSSISSSSLSATLQERSFAEMFSSLQSIDLEDVLLLKLFFWSLGMILWRNSPPCCWNVCFILVALQ